jgi:diaminopimelate decarboxylase
MLPLILEPTLHDLSQQQTDPLCAYIYDIDALRHHAANMREALPGNCELFYAAKANPEAKILQALAPLLDGFEAASGGELKWLRAQLPEQRLIFGGPGKLDSELEAALDLNVELIHVESLYELQKLQAIAHQKGTEASVLLRMNIAIGDIGQTRLSMGGRPTPFGIEQAQLPQALATLQECPNLKFKGFHFHLMSHQLDRKNHLKLMALYFETFKQWRQTYDLDINHLNVGGGIGINYTDPANTFDWPLFCTELGELIRSQQMQETTIRFECGRFVTAQCGYYSMEVLDIKQSHGETFVVARGGTHHFRTPAAQSHSHPFTICKRQDPIAAAPTIKQTQVTIVGQLCTPKDVLAKQQWVEDLSVGDHIVFTHAGAYAWNISHQNFLMHDKPQMVFLE